MKADLFQPCNWNAPISGTSQLLMTVPVNDGAKGMVEVEVPILAEYAFDYEPGTDDADEEIWDIEFVESKADSDQSSSSNLIIRDGGAQAYIGSQRVTTEPTREYPLMPEYEALYDQFFSLLQMNRSRNADAGEKAPSIVDCTTMAILKEITKLGKCTEGPRFEF